MKLPPDVEARCLALAGLTPAAPPPVADTVSKYRNQKVTIDGHTFASKKEAADYLKLAALAKAGAITDLQLQVPIRCFVQGHLVCKYVADFVYLDRDGVRHIIDAKGYRTPVYRLKKKLVEALYGIEIEEW